MDEYYTFYISLWRVFNKGRSREKNDQEKKGKEKERYDGNSENSNCRNIGIQ